MKRLVIFTCGILAFAGAQLVSASLSAGAPRSHIRRMIENFAKENKEISFRLQPATANEKTFDIVHVGNGPWQGPSFAVQYAVAYTTRKDNRRWMYPGAAFFEIQDGKIRNARFYMAVNERMEVFNR